MTRRGAFKPAAVWQALSHLHKENAYMATTIRPATVLVIEDHEPVRTLIEAVLETQGYIVLSAEDGAIGYEMARRYIPDIITLDLSMPNVDGHGALGYLKADEKTRGIPVVIVSAWGDQLAGDDAKSAAAVISKPFTVNDFTRTVAALLPAGNAI